ncbi:hypothetical protein GR140_31680 (plasmid) [Pseudomonas putida]|uniref:hypothetical protein n=1 Tax=Pseudomonas putida TaxID=303 RepID=UPI001BAFDFA9|nr:hypothetical protein [Pseudomonas putida]QUG93305.1 hypothetical protein GR140_31680 [Pseudomonas putida]
MRNDALRGDFVFPGLDITAVIDQQGHRVGHIDYGISLLHDRLYISDIKVRDAYRGHRPGHGLSLSRQYGLPLASLHEVGFPIFGPSWRGALPTPVWTCRATSAAAISRRFRPLGAPNTDPEHKRLIRELMVSSGR